jgi:uncharacterized protein DUF87
MFVIHDIPGGSLDHLTTKGAIEEKVNLMDYVKISQRDECWVGQVVQPNRNHSAVGSAYDNTVLHGLQLEFEGVSSQGAESHQFWEVLILGHYQDGEVQTLRHRPLPGAKVTKLGGEEVLLIVKTPQIEVGEDGKANVIGRMINADMVPLCINRDIVRHHLMISGGSGSGKSNTAAEVIYHESRFGQCVIVYDAKPDYQMMDRPNTDKTVTKCWPAFEEFGLGPCGIEDVMRVGFAGMCDASQVDVVCGFQASDFDPEILAAILFPEKSDINQAEALLQICAEMRGETSYTIASIIEKLEKMKPGKDINDQTQKAAIRKIKQRGCRIPWMDKVDQPIRGRVKRAFSSSLESNSQDRVVRFDPEEWVRPGRVIHVNCSSEQMLDQYYALILSHFLSACARYRRNPHNTTGITQFIDEAHRIFDNQSRYSGPMELEFHRCVREGRSKNHSIILSLQNASQMPPKVLNNLNSKIVMKQNSKVEAEFATQGMGKEYITQAMRLATGNALVSLHDSNSVLLVKMAPSPFELQRTDNVEVKTRSQTNNLLEIESLV